jgi:hypothetical protein
MPTGASSKNSSKNLVSYIAEPVSCDNVLRVRLRTVSRGTNVVDRSLVTEQIIDHFELSKVKQCAVPGR